jgi:hypothetical protein
MDYKYMQQAENSQLPWFFFLLMPKNWHTWNYLSCFVGFKDENYKDWRLSACEAL